MAALVTTDDVANLLGNIAAGANLQIFIDQADLVITEDLAGKGLSNSRLKMIELNLAAHFATIALERGGLSYQQAGDSREGYQDYTAGDGYRATRFGVAAIGFDTTGTLAASGTSNRAEIKFYNADYSPCNPVVGR